MRTLFSPDDQKAQAYIRDQLAQGKELSHFLLKMIDFAKGNFTIYLPDFTPVELIDGFHSSLVLNEVYALEAAGDEATYSFQEEAALVQSFLQVEERYVIWENQFDRWGDSYIGEAGYIPKPFFLFNQTLYHFIDKASVSVTTILKTMVDLASYPSIIVLTRYSQEISHGMRMDEAQMTLLATSTVHVLVGSHDNETWLIWSKAKVD